MEINDRRKTGLLEIIFFIILPLLYSTSLIDWDYLPKLICGLAFCLLIAIKAFISKSYKSINIATTPFIFAAAFMLIAGLNILRANDTASSIYEFYRITLLFVIGFSLLYYIKFHFSKEKFWWFNVMAMILIAFALLDYFMHILPLTSDYSIRSVRSTLANKNYFSETLLVLFPFSLISCTTSNSRQKQFCILSLLLIFVMIVILQTITVWLGLAIFTLVLLGLERKEIRSSVSTYIAEKKIKGKHVVVLFAVIISVGFYYAGSFSYLKPKLFQVTNYINKDYPDLISMNNADNQNSVFERIVLAKNALLIIKNNWLLGVGTSDWLINWPLYGMGGAPYLNTGVMHFEHPHNEFLFIFSEHGILGFSAFILFLISVLAIAYKLQISSTKKDKTIYSILFAGIISICIICFFGYPLHRPLSTILIAFMIAYILTEDKSKTKKISFNLIVLLIVGMAIPAFGIRMSSARLTGEINLRKALDQQTKHNFERMFYFLEKSGNAYYTTDDMGTPLSWYKGFAKYHSGNSDEALTYFLSAKEINPSHVQILSDIGAIYENQGKHNLAIQYYNQALKIIPLHYETRYNRAISMFNSSQIDEAYRQIFSLGWEPFKMENAQMVILRAYVKEKMDTLKIDNVTQFKIMNELNKNYVIRKLIEKATNKTLAIPEDLTSLLQQKN